MPKIRVGLMRRTGRRNWECLWTDPITGRQKTQSTKTHLRRDAERFAGSLEDRLNAGENVSRMSITFDAAADRYENEYLASLAKKTRDKFQAARNRVRDITDPNLLIVLDTSEMSKFQSGLRDLGLAEATIKGHLSALRAFFRWSKKMGLLKEIPHLSMPKRTGKMKGRPPTYEEFERILNAIPKVLKCPELGAEWTFHARGLWWSGLRLEESLILSWDDGDLQVVMTGKQPRLRIECNTDKSTKVRLLPLAPEFIAMLKSVPEDQRTGPVFRVRVPGQLTDRIRGDTCSKVYVRFGEEAKVLVATYPPMAGSKSTEPRKKWASAHDYRRAFGTRWSKVLKPQQLKELMRHDDIQTTMTFYVETTVEEVESAVKPYRHDTTNDPTNAQPIPTTEASKNAD